MNLGECQRGILAILLPRTLTLTWLASSRFGYEGALDSNALCVYNYLEAAAIHV